MTSYFAILLVLVLLGVMTHAGLRDGAFFSVYSLMRNGIALLGALTFCRPLGGFVANLAGSAPPTRNYFIALSFAFIVGGLIIFLRWLKIKFAFPQVECPKAMDWTVGPVAGLLNGIVITGVILVGWSMMPFVKYIPRDLGHVEVRPAVLDTGEHMLKTYGFIERRMGGNVPFLLEDEPIVTDADGNGRVDRGDSYKDLNRNGRWDRGWLWKYHHAADILVRDLEALNLSTTPES
jgi:hypothetical protein